MVIWKNVCIFYRNQTFSLCGSMHRVTKVNYNYHFLSAYWVLRFGLSSLQLLFLMFTIMLREGPRKQPEETACKFTSETKRDRWAEASAYPRVRDGTWMTLQSCPELKQGGCTFAFQHWPHSGFRLPPEREPNLGGDSFLGHREMPGKNPTGSHHQPALQAAGGTGLTHVSFLDVRSRQCITHVMHPYLTEENYEKGYNLSKGNIRVCLTWVKSVSKLGPGMLLFWQLTLKSMEKSPDLPFASCWESF